MKPESNMSACRARLSTVAPHDTSAGNCSLKNCSKWFRLEKVSLATPVAVGATESCLHSMTGFGAEFCRSKFCPDSILKSCPHSILKSCPDSILSLVLSPLEKHPWIWLEEFATWPHFVNPLSPTIHMTATTHLIGRSWFNFATRPYMELFFLGWRFTSPFFLLYQYQMQKVSTDNTKVVQSFIFIQTVTSIKWEHKVPTGKMQRFMGNLHGVTIYSLEYLAQDARYSRKFFMGCQIS